MVNERMQEALSPYLNLQATSPVQWYEWNEEAFNKAKNEEKPIFLSIGYTACHYCERMAKESFADDEIAKQLNEKFVPIKVDREELAEIDFVYMLAAQNMTGRAGWPLTLFLTPEKTPFYAATYLPKDGYNNVPGMAELVPTLAAVWANEREEVRKNAEVIHAYLQTYAQIKQEENSSQRIKSRIMEKGFEELDASFDRNYGGFVPAPKFPMPQNLMFLLKYGFTSQANDALAIAEKTLDHMYQGGIYDHVGFGFFRYANDPIWMIPHFEKILIDNAWLAMTYLWGYQYLGKTTYKRIAEEIIEYIFRELQSPEGGFYSSEAADSEGQEGQYYLWAEGEVQKVLGEEGSEFIEYYNIEKIGSFHNKSLPNLLYSEFNEKKRKEIETARKKLFEHRLTRVQPHKDKKILTQGNGVLIALLATAGRILQKKEYIEKAEKLAEFILKRLTDATGHLYRFLYKNQPVGKGLAKDYNAIIWGLLELYQADFKSKWLQIAVDLNKILLEDFYDESEGGIYFYSKKEPELLVRPKDFYDAALASDNSLATYNLFRLARLTNNKELFKIAEEQLRLFFFEVESNPAACGFWLFVFTCYFFQGKELVLLGEAGDVELEDLLPIIQQSITADWLVILKSSTEADNLKQIIPGLDNFTANPHNEINAYLGCGFNFGKVIDDIDTLLFALEASTFLMR